MAHLPSQTHEIQRKVDAGQQHIDGNNVFNIGRIPMSNTGLLRRIPSGCSRRECMTHSIEQVHSTYQQQNNQGTGNQQINQPQPFGHHTDFRMNLVVYHPCSFRREKHLVTYTENRQYSDGKEDNSQTADPLCKTPPEKHSVR